MVGTENGPRAVLIAGYQELTEEEFISNYQAELNKAIAETSSFLLSDEKGTSLKAYNYLLSQNVSDRRISIYTNGDHDTAIVHLPADAGSALHRIEGGDYERCLEMSEKSDGSIIWLRNGDQLKDHDCRSAADAVIMRFTGAKEAKRAVVSKSIRKAMAYYDTIV
jgi:hypothetical protein